MYNKVHANPVKTAMRIAVIIAICLLLVMTGGLIWLTGKPRITPVLPPDEEQALSALLPADVEHGNRITTYTSLGAMYDTLLDDISSAEHHVHMQFFKFEDDPTAQRVGDALAARAAHGVEARLMYDDFVCRRWKRYYRQLETRGVATAGFGRVRWAWVRKTDYYRNHRKCVVIDGRIAYLGGFNIADRYLHGLPWGCWRDTMIRIEGPAALAVQRAFAADWRHAGRGLLADRAYFPAVAVAGTLPLHLITSGPIGPGPSIMHYTAQLLDTAERYVWFESPYFIPPTPLRQALLRAARRGVDVRVLLPPRGDRGEVTQWASKSYLAEMLDADVRFGFYQPGYLHSKLVVCDDRVAMVGSCNIDPRSYLLCQEVSAVVDDATFATELRDIYLADEAQSQIVDAARWAARSCGEKAMERISRTVASNL